MEERLMSVPDPEVSGDRSFRDDLGVGGASKRQRGCTCEKKTGQTHRVRKGTLAVPMTPRPHRGP